MSLARLVYYSAVIGGWAAFFGWVLAECFFLRGRGDCGLATLAIVGALVGGTAGAGLNVVAGLANSRLSNLIMRVPTGLLGGGAGGALGILAGQAVYWMGLPRGLGFMLVGLGVGVVEGVYERSPSKIRNGALGGAIGGLAGGFFFDPLSAALASSSGIASRAVAFSILGFCVGAMVGFAQVVLKQASLRVLDGYGAGREVILSNAAIVLGRAEHLRLPFRGPANAELEPEHLRIERQSDGSFIVVDNQSRLGVTVRAEGASRYERVNKTRTLRDGDIIRFGPNLVRFNQRKQLARLQEKGRTLSPGPSAVVQPPSPPPPPPPPPSQQQKQVSEAVSVATVQPATPASQEPAATPSSAARSVTSKPSSESPRSAPQKSSPPPPPPPPPSPPPKRKSQ